jgi:hypothetical protein
MRKHYKTTMSVGGCRNRHVLWFMLMLIATAMVPGQASAIDKLLTLAAIPLTPKVNQFCGQAKEGADLGRLQTMLQAMTEELGKAEADYAAAKKAAEDAEIEWKSASKIRRQYQEKVDHLKALLKSPVALPEDEEEYRIRLTGAEAALAEVTTQADTLESARKELQSAVYKKEAAKIAFGSGIVCVNAGIEELQQAAVTPPQAPAEPPPPAEAEEPPLTPVPCKLTGGVPVLKIRAPRDGVCDFDMGYPSANPELTRPENGTVEWRAGHLIYKPKPGWHGRDNFTLSGMDLVAGKKGSFMFEILVE